MACPTDSTLENFAADQLPAELEQQVAEHLEKCSACAQRADAAIGGDDLLAIKQASVEPAGDAVTGDPVPEDLPDSLYRLAAAEIDFVLPPSEPTVDVFRLLAAEPADDVAGLRVGRFTIRRWLGAGGFGVVFLARDELLRRDVALKLPRVQSLDRCETRRRFLREAEAAAQLDHPGVVPVFEAGEVQGFCYIASGYCPGPTLSAWHAEQNMPVPVVTAAALVRKLAEAVQHAHEHRVLHRDIKPSNVLLEVDPERPGALAPKITDFGLAKLLDAGDSSMTGSQGMLGTPRYMAPEQAAGDRDAIGPTTDVFALGAILYELLVGVAPYAGDDNSHTLHRLLHQRVIPPRRLRRPVPADLEAICLKCLEKSPQDRYESAGALAEDLRRFEAGQATRARTIGWLETMRRWAARTPASAAALALGVVGLAVLVGVIVSFHGSPESAEVETHPASSETRRAQIAGEAGQEQLRNLMYLSKIQRAHQAIAENDLRHAATLLGEVRAETPELAGGFVWRYLYNQVVAGGHMIEETENAIYDLQVSPSGGLLAACGADSIVRLYEGKSFAPLRAFGTDQGEINAVAFTPDERALATAGDDGTVRLFDVGTGDLIRTIRAQEKLAYDLVFTPDGATLISCGRDPVIRLWDAETGEPRGVLEGHTEAVEAIALSPDGLQLASASSDDTARIWELAAGRTLHVLKGHTERVVDVQYSASGDELLTGSIDHTIRRWRTNDGACVQIENHVDPICSVAFLRGDSQLMASDRAGSVHVWQREPQKEPLPLAPSPAKPGEGEQIALTVGLTKPGEGGQEKAEAKSQRNSLVHSPADAEAVPLRSWKAHEGRAWEVAAAVDGLGVLSAGADGRVCYWQRPPTADRSLELTGDETIQDAVFARSSQVHFIHSASGLRTWDLDQNRQRALAEPEERDERRPRTLCMLAGGGSAIAYSDGAVEARGLPSRQRPLRWLVGGPADRWREISELAASGDGRRLAAFSFPRDATAVYDVANGELVATFEAYSQSMALSADGTRLAMSDGDDVVVWDVDQHELTHRFTGHTSSVVTLQFSPGGRWLASGSKDRHVRLWDLAGDRAPVTLSGHRDEVEAIAFSPDGNVLASGDANGELKFWLLAEAAEAISLDLSEPIHGLAFSPEGDSLAVQMEQRIHLVDAATPMAARPRPGPDRPLSRP